MYKTVPHLTQLNISACSWKHKWGTPFCFFPFCSAYTVLKFMMMWTLVLLADFILEFRLEYLWPCWLFFGSVYTTFHCHGLVSISLSFTFLCIQPRWWWPHNVNLMYYSLNWMCLVFAGYLCCFCLCCLYFGHLLFNFCSLALAVLCGQHLCIIQLHMAHRWVFFIILHSFHQNILGEHAL